MKIKLDPVTIIVYVTIIIIIIFALYCEFKDVRCQDFHNKCGPGMGRSYSKGKPEKGDSKRTLLEKASLTSRYEVNSIFWRRSFIAAIISSFLVLYVLKSKCPRGIELASALIIIYVVLYLTFTVFQRMITTPALKQMDDILEALKKAH